MKCLAITTPISKNIIAILRIVTIEKSELTFLLILYFHRLKDDKPIIMNCAENGAAVIVWKSEDYLKEASKQLKDKEVYLEVSIDSSAFVSTHYF